MSVRTEWRELRRHGASKSFQRLTIGERLVVLAVFLALFACTLVLTVRMVAT